MTGFTQRIMGWSRDGRKEKRRCGRIRVELIKSNLGEIVDMSGQGLRIRRKSMFKPKLGSTTVVLKTLDGVSTIPARIVRVESIGSRLWELGIKFENLSEDLRTTLTNIARVSCAGRSIDPSMPACDQRRSA